MCGIAGIHGAAADPKVVAAMTRCLVHRGPDGEGFFDAPGVSLGMRRLAIIDPESGHQPLRSEDGEVVAVFNGEIYNHAELRAGLEARGHRLRSGSDGEVIPHLYEELGPAFVERLNGIFAIALWDGRARALHLVRDRFGVKPLYHTRGAGGRLSFASEVRALLVDPSVSRELDPVAVDEFLTFRFVPSPRTALRAVRKLAPATILTAGESGTRLTEYATGVPEPVRRDRAALVEEYREAFERAVVRQMMSDVPIGVMLSGGVDSGAVCAVMARHASTVKAYTVGFAGGGPETDEIDAARRTAARFGASHSSVLVGESEYLAALPESMVTVEEPIGTTSAMAVRLVSDLMRPEVTVALSGQGADEPLGGYGRHRGVRIAELARRVPGARALAGALPRPAGRDALARGLDALAAPDDLALLMGAYRVLTPAGKRALYRPELAAALAADPGSPADAVQRLRSRVAHLSPLSQMLYVDTRLALPDELLAIADKMSMASSLELRVPMLDQDLVALAGSAAPTQHVRRLRGKALHKEALEGLLPDEIVHRPKLGWQTPVDRWLRRELRPLLRDVVLGEGEVCRELFEERELRRLADEHADGRADHARTLFCLLSLGLWHRGLVRARSPVPAAAAS
ncbi:MAG TPA: asparagine synthase (glutamine-hydrolyzing) [Solirubrobacteraceae bacterium]|nr:asparagine synthase (glutamine-hydrolyzing) [Solirubrobacteraceae bacterium]